MRKIDIAGFGGLGGEMVDFDLATAGDQEVRALGVQHLHDLVTVVRKAHAGALDLPRFHAICTSWAVPIKSGGYDRGSAHDYLEGKYGADVWSKLDQLDAADQALLAELRRITDGVGHLKSMVRVTGIRDGEGNRTGMFADGELDWHSNQQGSKYRSPAVGLLASEGTAGSQTQFLNTVEAYDAMSPAWQRTCDALVAVHTWTRGVMAPGLTEVQDRVLQLNMCPVDGTAVPLVQSSPYGHKGLHCPLSTIHGFEGKTDAESREIVDYLREHVYRDAYVYTHDWQDGDVLFFDNTITLHRRPTKDCSKRLLFRVSFNYDRLLPAAAA